MGRLICTGIPRSIEENCAEAESDVVVFVLAPTVPFDMLRATTISPSLYGSGSVCSGEPNVAAASSGQVPPPGFTEIDARLLTEVPSCTATDTWQPATPSGMTKVITSH